MLAKRLVLIFLATSFIFSTACGSDLFDNEDADVVSITIDNSAIPLGSIRRIVVNIEYDDDDVLSDDDDVAVVVLIPTGLEYVIESAEIDGEFDDEDVDPIRVPCPDGSELLFFNLDDDDLSGAEDPSSRADARLEMDLRAVALTPAADIQARADYNSTNASCGFPLDLQAGLIVSVVE